ncbi:trypsin-like [Nymphalis io]|uniref:trypsin-like n=1 Tax=Inachis io TaxID=171585 RepID=UPI00216807E7|nr:trypsin-like [Nymphalis io]
MLADLNRDPWGRPYRGVRGKVSTHGAPVTETMPPEPLLRLVEELFPLPGEHVPPRMAPRSVIEEEIVAPPQITEREMETALDRPLTHLEEVGPGLSEAQYGFRAGRSTIDALNALKTRPMEAVARGDVALAVSLDVANAFNSLPFETIREALQYHGVENGCNVTFRSSKSLMNFLKSVKIIGGRDALNNEFPYALRLEVKIVKNISDSNKTMYKRVCSGAALSSNWILTAAHCYQKKIEFVARYNSYFPNEIGKISPILKFFIHPQYNEQRFQLNQNDIALCLSQNLTVSQYGKISAVDYKALVGHKVRILGFGITNATASVKPLQVLDGMMNNCLEWDNTYYKATMMCVVPLCGTKATACPGDSGGPVVHSSGIVGVNSLGSSRCKKLTNGLYIVPTYSIAYIAMISHELDWISNVISKTFVG